MDSRQVVETPSSSSSSSSHSTGTSNGRGRGSRQQPSRSKDDTDDQQRRRKKESKGSGGGGGSGSIGSSGNNGKQKSAPSSLQNSPQSASTNQFSSSRFYHREVPPRFQLQKHQSGKQPQPQQSQQHTSSKHTKSNHSTKKPKESSTRWQHDSDTNSRWPSDADSHTQSMTTSRATSSSSSSTEGGGRKVHRTGTPDKDPSSYHHHATKGGWRGNGKGSDGTDIWGSQQSAGDCKLPSEQWTLSDEDCFSGDVETNGGDMDREVAGASSVLENGRHGGVPLDWEDNLSGGSDKDARPMGLPARSKTFPRDMAKMGEDKSLVSRHISDSDPSKDFASSSQSLREAVENQEGALGDGSGWRIQQSRGSVGSTSSVNSVGSSSSWRNTRAGSNGSGGGGGNYARSTSPRKNSNHSGNSYVGKSSSRYSSKGKKPVLDLHVVDSLNDAPNGWGELPSPGTTDLDTGTEVWGIPEDVKKRMNRGRMDGSVGGWGDRVTTPQGGWTDGVSWNQNGADCDAVQNQWGGGDHGNSSGRVPKQEMVLHENVKKLVDMGFNYEQSEKALKINKNNLEDALGDLLTINCLSQDDSMNAFASSPLNARKHPGSGSINGAHMKPSFSSAGPMSNAVSSSASSSGVHHTLSGFSNQQAVSHHNHLSMGGAITPGLQPQMNHIPNHQSHGRGLSNKQLTIQQDITHKLAHFQQMKQNLAMKLNQLKTSSQPHQASQQHQMLTLQLSQVNSNISSLNQQLLLVSQPSAQQPQYKGPGGGGRNTGKQTDFKTMNGIQNPGGYSSRSDHSGYYSSNSSAGGNDMSGLSYGVQNMSVGAAQSSFSHSSTSRLQQIISGPSPVEIVDRDGNRGLDNLSSSSGRPGFRSGNSNMQPAPEPANTFSADPHSHTATTTSSSMFASKRNLVDEIPEFKPGVPWQPRSQTKETSQTFGNSVSYNTTTSASYFPSSDAKYSSSSSGLSPFAEDSEAYFPPSSKPAYPSGFNTTSSQNQLGGGGGTGFDSQRQYHSGYNSGRGAASNKGTQRGTRPANPRGSYTFGGHSSGQFGMASSSHPRASNQLYMARGQTLPSSQNQYPSTSGSNGFPGAASQGFNQPKIPRGFESKNWSTDSGNPWGSKSFSGNNIWGQNSISPAPPSDTYLSQESPSVDWKTTSAAFSQQPPPAHAPSLHSGAENTSSSTSVWLIIANVPSTQIDETSLREVCSEYGQVETCIFSSSSDSAIIRYSSAQEAAMAVNGLLKNPVICGVIVKPRFATEADLSAFFDPSPPSFSHSSSWLAEPATSSAISSSAFSQRSTSQPGAISLSSSTWGPPALGSSMSGSSVNSPSSVWGNSGSDDSGLLTGMIPNPWGAPTTSSSTSSSSTHRPPHQDVRHQEEAAIYSTSPSLSTLLPNGLL